MPFSLRHLNSPSGAFPYTDTPFLDRPGVKALGLGLTPELVGDGDIEITRTDFSPTSTLPNPRIGRFRQVTG
jgi:hypothetical protein